MRNQTLSHCNKCGADTYHDASPPIEVKGYEVLDKDSGGYEYTERFETLDCRGCERVSLRHTFLFGPSGEETVTLYPPPAWRHPPRWRFELPEPLRELMYEIYTALQNDARRLALMGARALLDMVITDLVGDVGSFSKKLQALQERGFIGATNSQVLEAALNAGNAAIHRGHLPLARELTGVMDIVENLLQSAYHFSKVAAELQTIPGRNSVTKRPPG